MAVIVAFSFMAGCGKRTPEPTATHHESGRYYLILSEIYGECMANNDIQGAKDALDMITKFSAFYCSYVNYDDVKNKLSDGIVNFDKITGVLKQNRLRIPTGYASLTHVHKNSIMQ